MEFWPDFDQKWLWNGQIQVKRQQARQQEFTTEKAEGHEEVIAALRAGPEQKAGRSAANSLSVALRGSRPSLYY